LVEDEDAVLKMAARVLRDHGYTVFEARGAREARVLCQEHRTAIDLLLTDVVMPEVSGPELAEELLNAMPGLRVLFMSGYPGGALRLSRLPPATDFIEKPFAPSLLARKVSELLGN
jgi:DNA-binding NtrC family response regulator